MQLLTRRFQNLPANVSTFAVSDVSQVQRASCVRAPERMSVRLRVEQDDTVSPAHKRVRLSLSPSALATTARGSPATTAAQTATPDLFDATPTEATGVAPGRRKSSRSRVYSQRSSGGCKWRCLL